MIRVLMVEDHPIAQAGLAHIVATLPDIELTGAFEKVEDVVLQECTSCGQVTTGAVCAFCKLADLVKRRASPVQ